MQQKFIVNNKDFEFASNVIIGEGIDCNVILVRHKLTQKVMALKYLREQNDKNGQLKTLQTEISILNELDHPHINAHLGHSLDFTCMLMDYHPNGTFYKVIQKQPPLPIGITKRIMVQLSDAIMYLHQNNIIHGDLKPENIIISTDFNIKICDFGFAQTFKRPIQPLYQLGGTKGYTAPEFYTQPIDDLMKFDVFSLGVVFFIMVTGTQPFKTNNPYDDDPWWRMLKKKDYNVYWSLFNTVLPQEFKIMVEGMLNPLPLERWSIQQVINFEWLQYEVASCTETQAELSLRSQK